MEHIELKSRIVFDDSHDALDRFDDESQRSDTDRLGESRLVEVSRTSPRDIQSIISEADFDRITNSIVKNCLTDQRKLKKLLSDVTESQRVILETVQQENAKFSECQVLREVCEVMEKAKIYHSKLLSIKKDMLQLHEKSAELKRRAVRIQQEKQKAALMKEQQREQELEKERKLTAQMAKRTN